MRAYKCFWFVVVHNGHKVVMSVLVVHVIESSWISQLVWIALIQI